MKQAEEAAAALKRAAREYAAVANMPAVRYLGPRAKLQRAAVAFDLAERADADRASAPAAAAARA